MIRGTSVLVPHNSALPLVSDAHASDDAVYWYTAARLDDTVPSSVPYHITVELNMTGFIVSIDGGMLDLVPADDGTICRE